jgi:L-amino acid N-acyltransferase YncA
MAEQGASHDPYPKQIEIADGTQLTIRRMTPEDHAEIMKFSAQLPERDLLFLRIDITDPAIVKEWIENLKSGRTVTLLAKIRGEIVAYASVHMEHARWTRHVGEVRLNLLPLWRSRGLGRRLASEIFDLAPSLGIKKLAVMMTPDQAAARRAFERLGFRVEAFLTDWVEDRSGKFHDLLVMTHDLAGFSDQLTANR